MNRSRSQGFTLVEVLIVVVIMAVLAAVVIPQFSASTDDAKKSTAEFNLSTLRSILQTYKGQHKGALPDVKADQDLPDILTGRTESNGTVAADGEYGPYLVEFPENPFSGSNAVKEITNTTAAASDVTAGGTGGWLYNETTGSLWLDYDPGYDW